MDMDSNSDSVSCQTHGIDTAGKDEDFCWCHLEDSDQAMSFSCVSKLPVCCLDQKKVLAAAAAAVMLTPLSTAGQAGGKRCNTT